MALTVEVLEWDSEFFGVPIGSAYLDGLDSADLTELDNRARDLGIECLYGRLDPAAGEPGMAAQQAGHRLVEVAVTFRRPAGPFTPRPSPSRVRAGSLEDLPALAASIDALAPWSRFAVDPRFGLVQARRMHEAWARRACTDGADRMLTVSEDNDGITGFATQVRGDIPRVDLIATTAQGTHASWQLLDEFLRWAGGGEVEVGPCAARNPAVLRFLERCGFAVSAVSYLFHRWLDETAQ